MFQHTETEQEKLYDICMKSDHPNVMLCPFECHIESKEAKSNTEKLKYKLTFNSIKKTSTSNPFLCAADFFLQLGSCKEAIR